MKVISGIGNLKQSFNKSVVVIGVFDGVHRGHQYLIAKAVKQARKCGCPSVVITFDPHPARVMRPDLDIPYLISFHHRLKQIEACGADYCLVVRFTKRFAAMAPESFVKRYLVGKLGARDVFVGDDFRFGKDRAGNAQVFKALGKQYGFAFHSIDRVTRGAQPISSTRIRALIREGKLSQAARLLGRPVTVMGRVVRGDGRGRSFGYPTANIALANDILPPHGVYVVEVEWKGRVLYGMANVGYRPSFKHNAPINLEVYLFDFDQRLYRQELSIRFLKKIRNEQTFPTIDAFVKQLKKDEGVAKRYLKKE